MKKENSVIICFKIGNSFFVYEFLFVSILYNGRYG